MNTPTNPTLEELLPDVPNPLTGSAQQRGDDYITSEAELEDSEPEFDVTQHFDPIDDGKPNAPTGRPDDYPGFESLEVLLTAGGRYRAGKSYRPDLSGVRRAVKVDDYTLGWVFLCQVWFGSLEASFCDPARYIERPA